MSSKTTADPGSSVPLYRNRCKHRSNRSHRHPYSPSHDKYDRRGHRRVRGDRRSGGSRTRKFDSRSAERDSEAPNRKGLGDLPPELVIKIAAAFDIPTLRAASSACRSWREVLRPLREAMLLFLWGKRFKKGEGPTSGGQVGYAVRRDPEKALQSFLKAAALGSALGMVDAGLMLWEMGRKEEGKEMYRKAAELGHPAGQHNLAAAYLEDGTHAEEAVNLLLQAARSGYSRAQYSLAVCLHHGRGVKCDKVEAVKWYMRAAEGGNARAMYNISLCYFLGEVLVQDQQQAKVWLKRAADNGHQKAQMELASQLIDSGHVHRALFYLELAVKAGELSAIPIIEAVHQGIL